ncbi:MULTISPECIES: hypothetical protein [unclassified Streptomyces]|uniref:hypothetical protein n=1 Tax=unclassified Streptomyces TaxID=2593676 RepID=UPI002E2D7EE7|nr:hypothetical protein [Streptomyces sp. NBC_01429]
MNPVPLLLGLGITLPGLALVTDYRGCARYIVDTHLNPIHADSSLKRAFSRLGFDHRDMGTARYAPRARMLLRIWGGFATVFGLLLIATGIMVLTRR